MIEVIKHTFVEQIDGALAETSLLYIGKKLG
jgi:hypothetical protein